MCLIVHNPDSRSIDNAILSNGITNNPDGWGIMFADSGRIQTFKGMTRKSFDKRLRKLGARPLTIHFRWATHGFKNTDNCHPFIICNGAYALMHNGIIDIDTPNMNRSDTWHFADEYLGPILQAAPQLFGTPILDRIVSDRIGHGNKIVLLRADGQTQIIHAHEGVTHEGLWLSNAHGWKPPVAKSLDWTKWKTDWTRETGRKPLSITSKYPDASRQGGWDDGKDFKDDEISDIDIPMRDLISYDPRYDDPREEDEGTWMIDSVKSIEELSMYCDDAIVDYCRDNPEAMLDMIRHLYG